MALYSCSRKCFYMYIIVLVVTNLKLRQKLQYCLHQQQLPATTMSQFNLFTCDPTHSDMLETCLQKGQTLWKKKKNTCYPLINLTSLSRNLKTCNVDNKQLQHSMWWIQGLLVTNNVLHSIHIQMFKIICYFLCLNRVVGIQNSS